MNVLKSSIEELNKRKKRVAYICSKARNGMNQIYNFAKYLFKCIEDKLLILESKIIKASYCFENNQNVEDYTGSVIKNQDDVSEYKLGKHSLGDVGCEVVAVYNVIALTRNNQVSLLDIIKTFENQGALVLQAVLKGKFGSNPYAISRVLNAKNIRYRKISSLNALKEPGIYIVSYWNSFDWASMIHSVTIEITLGGEYNVMNAVWNTVVAGKFITGYEILGEQADSSVKKYKSRI